MIEWSQRELLYLLVRSVVCGVAVGVLYDILRTVRIFLSGDGKAWRVIGYAVTFIADFIVWSSFGVISILLIYKLIGGAFRGMVYVGMLVGAALYYYSISKLTLRITRFAVKILKKALCAVGRVIIFPFVMVFHGVFSLYRLTIGKIIGKIIRRVREVKKSRRVEDVPASTDVECGKEELVYVFGKAAYRRDGRIDFGRK